MKKYFDYWIPIYKKMYFKYRMNNEKKAIKELKMNIYRNMYLSEKEKEQIWFVIKGVEHNE